MVSSKLSGIKLPKVYGVGKGLDPHAQSEKQTNKRNLQIKQRLGQGEED